MKYSDKSSIIYPERLAHERYQLKACVELSELSRLCAILHEVVGQVNVDLSFGLDTLQRTFIKGHIETQLILTCQCCLKPLIYPIVDDICLSPVTNDSQADKLADIYDAVYVKRGGIALHTLVEDELFIRLPLVAQHTQNCQIVKSQDIRQTKVKQTDLALTDLESKSVS